MINLVENKDTLIESHKELNGERIVCWFSHGIASTVAAKLAIETNNASDNPLPLEVVSIYLKNEHEDNERYMKECEKWLGQKIVVIGNEKYDCDVDTVIEKFKYMAGVNGARCTKELKKEVRYQWQRHTDIHVFGMTSEEEHRINQILDAEAELEIWAPLIEAGYTKTDCFNLFDDTGIAVPMMYQLGYNNNNCIGCVKAGGAGYWNHTRKYFPEVFNRRAHQEKMLGVALCKLAANVFINKHTQEFSDFIHAKLSGDLKEIKIDGKDSPVRKADGKPQNCVMLPAKFYEHYISDVAKEHHEFVPANTVKKVDYDSYLVNTYEMANEYTSVFWQFIEHTMSSDWKGKKTKIYGSSVRIPLRYLPKDAGDQKSMYVGDCGFFCEVKDGDN